MDRPAEALIQQQKEELEAEIARRPLVCPLEPMSSLAREYAHASDVFRSKVAYLCNTYRGIHYIRGDGNCFVRGAAVFGLLNYLRVAEPHVRDAVVAVLKGSCQRMVSVGYSEFVVEDFYDAFMDEVKLCVEDGQSEQHLIERLQDKSVSDYCVMFMRFFIATIMLENEADWISFAPNHATMRDYVKAEIEPMNTESEELSLIAFSHVGVSFAVEYLDQSGSPDRTNSHVFRPPNAPEDGPLAFTLLFRPGHFDIIVK